MAENKSWLQQLGIGNKQPETEIKGERFIVEGNGIDVSGVLKDLMRGHGNVTYSRLDEEQYVQQGWAKNPTVRGIISKVQEASTKVKWKLVNKEGEQVENKMLEILMENPNAINTWSEFIQNIIMFHMLTGNAFIVMDMEVDDNSINKGLPQAIVNLPAQNVQINLSPDRKFIQSYDLDYLSFTGQVPGENVIHLRESNPDYDFDERNSFLYGTPRLASAMRALDTNNEIIDTLMSVYVEGGPRGVLGVKANNDPGLARQLDEVQLKKVEADLQRKYKGGRNAGKFPINNIEWNWTQIGADIGDLKIKEMLESTSLEICKAFNFPYVLISAGESTYNNQNEAKKEMWESVVLPRIYMIKEALNQRLVPLFGNDIMLECDLSGVAALKEDEEKKARQYSAMNWLTVNEKREAFGYEPIEGGDELDNPMSAFAMPSDDDIE